MLDYSGTAVEDDRPLMGLLCLRGQGNDAGTEQDGWLAHGGHHISKLDSLVIPGNFGRKDADHCDDALTN
jgi:hypothetical protein